jgi:hypothetical protein
MNCDFDIEQKKIVMDTDLFHWLYCRSANPEIMESLIGKEKCQVLKNIQLNE